MTLDKVLDKYHIIRASVGKIIDTLYEFKRYPYTRQSGSIIHYKLGFINDQLFQRYYIDNILSGMGILLLIRGVPDRIIPPYVDELKTTITGKESKVIRIAKDQLMLYMYLTGLPYGRIYVYYKDTNELKHVDTIEYNNKALRTIIERFLILYLPKLCNTYNNIGICKNG